jgi:hypothetical protein
MADTKEISGKEQCDLLNSFKDHEGNNTEVSQHSKEKHMNFLKKRCS